MLTNKKRNYHAKDYCLVTAAIFVDPPGSCKQRFHEDMHGFDRHPVWNAVFPLQIPQNGSLIAESIRDSNKKRNPQGFNDVVVWDSNWKHRGKGNDSPIPRIQIHLVFCPKWMVLPAPKHVLDYFMVSQEDQTEAAHEIEREYNGGKPISDKSTCVGYWVALAGREC